jgi:predicted DNA-binding transcriptional regulator YafY
MRRGPKKREPIASARTTLQRMVHIHTLIQRGKLPNANSLAKELSVSTKSIHRDLQFMRDRLGLPWAYDEIKHGYYYTCEVGAFPTFQVSEGELFALVLAEKALQQYRGTPFEAPLKSAFEKISTSLPDTISVNWSDWDQSVSFHTSSEPILKFDVFGELSRAASERQQVRLQYRKPGAKQPESRVVDPYRLANVNGEWFLFAHCHLRKDIRTFVPSRILSIERTGEMFDRPSKFSLEQRLRDAFGVHSGAQKHEVTIRFSPRTADYIREKKWHPSQKTKELRDGGVELHLELSSLDEIKRWILGWAGEATVLSPPELIAAVRSDARSILASTKTG